MNLLSNRIGWSLPLVVGGVLALPAVAAATVSVCVEVETKSWSASDAQHSTPDEEEAVDRVADPFAIDPARYLGRMVQYEVTHEVGFEAVEANCTERLVIERQLHDSVIDGAGEHEFQVHRPGELGELQSQTVAGFSAGPPSLPHGRTR